MIQAKILAERLLTSIDELITELRELRYEIRKSKTRTGGE